MGNEFINLQVAVEVIIHETGELGAALDATECAALPDATSDKLEC